METGIWIDGIPLIGIYAGTFGLVILSLFLGFLAGKFEGKSRDPNSIAIVGSVVAAMFGLIAFVLAFSFGMASSRFDTRRKLLLEEVNAIGTAMLRANLLPEPLRSESQSLIRRYVDTRAVKAADPGVIRIRIVESEKILDELWQAVYEANDRESDTPIRALYISSLNDVTDLHTSRVSVWRDQRIPPSFWVWIIVATVIAMTSCGWYFSSLGRRAILLPLLFAALYSTLVLLVIDLDRPSGGSVQLEIVPMLELKEKLSPTTSR